MASLPPRGMVAVMEREEGVSRGGGEVMVPPPLPQNDGEMRCGRRRVGRGGRSMASRRCGGGGAEKNEWIGGQWRFIGGRQGRS